jgi:hypothetical protein
VSSTGRPAAAAIFLPEIDKNAMPLLFSYILDALDIYAIYQDI